MDLNIKNVSITYASEKIQKTETKDNYKESMINIHPNFQNLSKYSQEDINRIKETVQSEIEKSKKSELTEDSFDDACEEELMNNSNDMERGNSIEEQLKNLIDRILKETINMISSKRNLEEDKIISMKAKLNDLIQKNNIDYCDVINILTIKLNEMITSQKDCVLENFFSIQIKETLIQDLNFKKDDFINKYKKEICFVIDKLYKFFCLCISSAEYLEEIFEYVIKKLANMDEKIPKINIDGIIKEEFTNSIINDNLIKKLKGEIGKKHFKILNEYSNEGQFKEDLRNIFFKDKFIEDDNESLKEKMKQNIKFKKDDPNIDINELVKYILKDESMDESKPPKKRKGKNKKKSKKNDVKNVSKNSNSNISNGENLLDENEVCEFRNKLRDWSVNAKNV